MRRAVAGHLARQASQAAQRSGSKTGRNPELNARPGFGGFKTRDTASQGLRSSTRA
jgi:hypothetical protein